MIIYTLHSTLFILVPGAVLFVVRRVHSTFHSVYISTGLKLLCRICQAPLHSTLFILVLVQQCDAMPVIASTFHSVYISTVVIDYNYSTLESLHSTLFILVPSSFIPSPFHEKTLHSTLFILVPKKRTCIAVKLYLYIPLCLYQYGNPVGVLAILNRLYIPLCLYQYYLSISQVVYSDISTFHSVYISTGACWFNMFTIIPLHSTLFILVRQASSSSISSFVTLHSTLFILVLWGPHTAAYKYNSTFHSVYISTRTRQSLQPSTSPTLHSTLFILVPNGRSPIAQSRCSLYIPLCLYQYPFAELVKPCYMQLYIPLCLYQYCSASVELYFDRQPLHSTLFILVHGCSMCMLMKEVTLHSTLFILVPLFSASALKRLLLYIPLCLYQYK